MSALTVIGSFALALLLSAPGRSADDDGRWLTLPSEISREFLQRDPTVTLETKITGGAVAAAPKWKAEDQHPPLSVRRAITLSDQLRSRLVRDANGWQWHLESAALTPWTPERPNGHWFWVICYRAYPPGGMSGPSDELNVVVLMDGTVVQPAMHRRANDADALRSCPAAVDNTLPTGE